MTWKGPVRLEVWYAPDERFHEEPSLEVSLHANDLEFAVCPAPGDTFVPGALGWAARRLGPASVARMEHYPVIPNRPEIEDWQKTARGILILEVRGRKVPESRVLQQIRDEGMWDVHDFRDQSGHLEPGDR